MGELVLAISPASVVPSMRNDEYSEHTTASVVPSMRNGEYSEHTTASVVPSMRNDEGRDTS